MPQNCFQKNLGSTALSEARTIFDSDGKLTGLKTLLCGKDGTLDNIKALSGSHFIEKNFGINPENMAFVYDEFTDITVMKNGGLFILTDFDTVPWRTLTDISIKFRTYDILIERKNLGKLLDIFE